MRLSESTRLRILLVLGGVYLSGLLWLLLHYGLAQPNRFGPPRHPWEPEVLAVHGLMALVALVAIGALLPLHARSGWRARRNRSLGALLLLLSGWAALSGWGLYYAGGEQTRHVLSLLHWSVLVPAPLVVVAHVLRGRAIRRSTMTAPVS